MTDHAHELRRHARKIWRPAGDIPAVMQAAADHIDDLKRRLRATEQDAQRYRLVRRGQHWSTINGIGDTLRGDALDSAIDAVIADQPPKGGA